MPVCPRCGGTFPDDATFCPEDGARLDAVARESLVGVTLEQRYLLEERIGAGGLGQVYRARHLRMDRAFAVKLLLPTVAANADLIQRFDREARALSRLSHPCCVAVTDYGVSEQGPYIVMELVQGRPLSYYTRGEGMPLQESVELVCTMLRGLEHAHGQGIAHRDLKPDNIMLVQRPLEPWRLLPKILDFGLAKIQAGFGGSQLTQAGLLIGTPAYMAPERIARPTASDDTLADIYSVGILLYELCCGRRPFVDDDVMAVVNAQLHDAPPPPSSLRPSTPPALERVILRALAKRPAERHPSAAALREDLERLLPLPPDVAGERPPREAPRSTGALTRVERPARESPPASPAARRSGRRGPLLIGAVLAVLLAGAGGAWLLLRGPSGSRPARRDGPTARRSAGEPAAPVARPDSKAAAPQGQTDDAGLPPALQRATRLWRNPRSRQRAAREFMRFLGRHKRDAAAHLYVGRTYLYSFWADDGAKLVAEATRIDPSLRLDPPTLMALTFAYRGSSLWIARKLIATHAGDRASRVLLASAAAMRDQRIRRNLINDARKRGAERDPQARLLLVLARARTCKTRRRAFAALQDLEAPELRIMLALLEHSRCLAAQARAALQR